ncbi:MAG: glycosyltransferase family 9 protein, partial [Pyrinomonadaceae bacterium]
AVFLGPEEAGLREQVAALFPAATVIIDGLSIPQFIAAASRLAAFVTNDTGPMHLAACAEAPILLLIDERAPTTYLPLTEKIEIVRNQTIDRITVDNVYRAAKLLLTKFPASGDDKISTP